MHAALDRRRVIANITLSLDGRTTGPAGPYDMGWIVPHAITEAAREGLRALTATVTTVLLGRTNYEGFGSYWPQVARSAEADPRDRAFAQWLDEVQKLVFSTTLTEARWSHSRIERRPPAEVVRELRSQGTGDIAVLASQSIIRALLAADELDRLSINLAPELVGGGDRLFEEPLAPASWSLDGVTTSDSGAVWLLYDRRPSTGR